MPDQFGELSRARQERAERTVASGHNSRNVIAEISHQTKLGGTS
jgi:hypothetical protein